MTYNRQSTALLPTRTNIKVAEVEKNEFFDVDCTIYIIRKLGANTYRAVSGYGAPYESLINGTGGYWSAHHDQTGVDWGQFIVVGYIYQGEVVDLGFSGGIPTRSLPLSVFK